MRELITVTQSTFIRTILKEEYPDYHDAMWILANRISIDGTAQMVKDERYWVYLEWIKYLTVEVK